MRSRACGCSGSKLRSDRTPLPSLDRTTSSSFCPWPSPSLLALISVPSPMALTGARKLKWSCAYDYHSRNFFDALLLSLADQHPLFQQVGREPTPAPTAPVKAGLQTTGHRSPPLKEEASPNRKTTGRTQPKRPAHPPKHAAAVDPTHEKLLAVLSHAARFPDTAEVGAAMSATDLPPASPGDMEMPPTMDPVDSRPPRQAASSGLPAQQCPSHGHIQYRIAEDGMREHLPPPRAFAHPKKCPVQ